MGVGSRELRVEDFEFGSLEVGVGSVLDLKGGEGDVAPLGSESRVRSDLAPLGRWEWVGSQRSSSSAKELHRPHFSLRELGCVSLRLKGTVGVMGVELGVMRRQTELIKQVANKERSPPRLLPVCSVPLVRAMMHLRGSRTVTMLHSTCGTRGTACFTIALNVFFCPDQI